MQRKEKKPVQRRKDMMSRPLTHPQTNTIWGISLYFNLYLNRSDIHCRLRKSNTQGHLHIR